MELSVYNIIKRAIITEKSWSLLQKLGKVTFEVDTRANKVMIRHAVEKIWDVKVDKICVINNAGKNKIYGRRPYTCSDKKKAIVTLKKGYKIDLPGQIEAMASRQEQHHDEGEE